MNLINNTTTELCGLYMKKYVLKRLLLMIPTFLGVTIVVYLLMSLAPGSPMDAFLSVPGITEAELLRIKESIGLDKPVFVQYFHWLVNILQGNFGYSFSGSRPVMGLIMDRVPATLMLGTASLILSFIIAIPLGLWAAARWRKGDDYVLSGISFFLMSVPNFFIGFCSISKMRSSLCIPCVVYCAERSFCLFSMSKSINFLLERELSYLRVTFSLPFEIVSY